MKECKVIMSTEIKNLWERKRRKRDRRWAVSTGSEEAEGVVEGEGTIADGCTCRWRRKGSGTANTGRDGLPFSCPALPTTTTTTTPTTTTTQTTTATANLGWCEWVGACEWRLDDKSERGNTTCTGAMSIDVDDDDDDDVAWPCVCVCVCECEWPTE